MWWYALSIKHTYRTPKIQIGLVHLHCLFRARSTAATQNENNIFLFTGFMYFLGLVRIIFLFFILVSKTSIKENWKNKHDEGEKRRREKGTCLVKKNVPLNNVAIAIITFCLLSFLFEKVKKKLYILIATAKKNVQAKGEEEKWTLYCWNYSMEEERRAERTGGISRSKLAIIICLPSFHANFSCLLLCMGKEKK